jgi:hypothetical protein
MIYVKSALTGLACVFLASFLVAEAAGTYLKVVYHVGGGHIGWNSNHFETPLNWLFDLSMLLIGFYWEFRRLRVKGPSYYFL